MLPCAAAAASLPVDRRFTDAESSAWIEALSGSGRPDRDHQQAGSIPRRQALHHLGIQVRAAGGAR
jgi:hypothetical protein